jgi:nitrate/nitrite transporter NarK
MLMGSMFNIILAILSYKFIVLPRKLVQQAHKKNDSAHQSSNITLLLPYLFGFGVIMPLATIYPYYCIPYFGVKNKLLKFFFGVQSLTTFFRCSEGTASDAFIIC